MSGVVLVLAIIVGVVVWLVIQDVINAATAPLDRKFTQWIDSMLGRAKKSVSSTRSAGQGAAYQAALSLQSTPKNAFCTACGTAVEPHRSACGECGASYT